ncbi:MAG: PAS domain-containing protein [Verrucomicrobia bacterium]|nr:PAS domain-containing protein [Verrucomicrobiota bacterium]
MADLFFHSPFFPMLSVLLIAGLLLLWVKALRLRRSLEEARRACDRWAPAGETGAPGAAIARRIEQVGERLERLEQQRKEQEAVFVSMVEGVMALDEEERVININHAAARLFGVPRDKARNRHLQELARNADLQQLVTAARSGDQPVEGDITLFSGEDRHLQVHASRLRDAGGRGIGVLVVLNDVTRLRRLENLRRDFVANVSHELKTPITSIKGFIETLQDGALKSEEDARRFLEIMARQADRLNAIIEDLLHLSRVEEEAAQQDIELKEQPLHEPLQAALHCCHHKAETRQISIELKCEPGLCARINAPLLEQAVVNLLDNAIKYSAPSSPVEVEVVREEGGIAIRVRDRGCGIAVKHLPRLFERFYRVDKARSRQMGGTGLGLAIVKHIAQAHGGSVTVESTPGQGSVFGLHLPG